MPSLQYLVFRNIQNDHIADIFDEVYLKKIYDAYVLGKKDLVIADFGANQGLTTYFFSPYAKVLYAVEPSIIHQEVLREMIKLNEIKNVAICPYAISNKNGKTTFYHSPNPTSFSLTPLPNTGTEEVETVTIKEFFKRNNIDHLDILKLDIEGEEGKLIASPEFEEICPKIEVILGEYHDWSGVSKDLFMNRFRDLGYHFEWRGDTKAAVFEAKRV